MKKKWYKQKSTQGVGLNYFDICYQIPEDDKDHEISIKVAQNLREILECTQQEYQSNPNLDSWFTLHVKGFCFDSNRYAIISHREVMAQTISYHKLAQILDHERHLNHLKSQFLSIVSHEFRTPLTILMTQIYLFRMYHPDLDSQNGLQRLHHMEETIRSLDELLDDLISIEQYELQTVALHKSSFNIENFVKTIIQNVESTFHLSGKVKLIVRGTVRTIISDQTQLKIIIINLLSNSIKYTPNPNSKVYVVIEVTYKELQINIRDEGIGIPDDAKSKLFNIFFRASNAEAFDGKGLGLITIKHAVELLQGTIQIKSELGQGTTCSVFLPISQPN